MALALLLTAVCALVFAVLIAQSVLKYWRSPLRNLPGPFLARFTNIWRLYVAYQKKHIVTQQQLHREYGDYVRIGPNVVSIADPNLVKTIYSTRGTFVKSEFYAINDAMQDGRIIQNIFGTRSNEFHARYVRPVQKLYTLQAARDFEPAIDKTLNVFSKQLEARFISHGNICDIADWISYLTWDILGELTFSKRFGFLEEATDVGGMLATAEKTMDYQSVVGQMPTLDKYLAKNPRLAPYFPAFSVTAGFCVQQFIERMQNLSHFKESHDFTNQFLRTKEEYPDVITDNEVISYMIVNVLGGGDTTSIVIKAIVYHTLKNPSVHARLVAELRSSLHTHPAPYTSLDTLPYLAAVVKEGCRIHPIVGHMFERVVPASGLALANGVTLPPGTIVGVNPWVVHQDAAVYGAHPERFIPERWLQSADESVQAYEARMRRMKEVDLSFGSGRRVCMGKPLALLEISKIVGMVFGKWKISLEDPHQEWEVHPQWFVWPHKIRVRMENY